MHPADQATAAAMTTLVPGQPLATPLGRAERAMQLREYFALQLHFAEVVAAKTALPFGDVVEQYTNLYKRFGFGIWPDTPRVPAR